MHNKSNKINSIQFIKCIENIFQFLNQINKSGEVNVIIISSDVVLTFQCINF